MKKILLVLTGGTICTLASDGVRSLGTQTAKRLLVENFINSDSTHAKDVEFVVKMPINILSENMDIGYWNDLITFFKNENFDDYDGVIVAHGTDTLAYTTTLFSLLLQGITRPMVFVSAHAPLDNPLTNGNENFKIAVEGILDGTIQNGVYVVYKNLENKKMIFCKGHELKQCDDHSDDFECKVTDLHPVSEDMLIEKLKKLDANILFIKPYTGINYDNYDIKNVRAILHGTYHSGTVESKAFKIFSKRCKDMGIPVFLSPCKCDGTEVYSTVAEALSEGAVKLSNFTVETTYCKMLIAFSMYDNEKAIEFVES